MNNLVVITEYIDRRNGRKLYFDQYGKGYETLMGLDGFFSKLKEKAGTVFSKVKNFLQTTSQKVVGVFQPKDDGTIEQVSYPGGVDYPGGTLPASPNYSVPAVQQAGMFGMDNQTLMIGGALLIGGLLYYKNQQKGK